MSTIEMAPVTLEAKIKDFLAQQRIAVAGVSRTHDNVANRIYRRFKAAGYQVVPINPTADAFDGDPCYPDLPCIPGSVDGVVIVTRPAVSETIVRQCPAAGVTRVWMHQSMTRAGTSVSAEAAEFCRDHGITVIAGACPLMFGKTADVGHRCMCWVMRLIGGLPR